MLEKLGYTVGGLTLAFSWVAGYAWAQGDTSPGPDASVVASRPTSTEVTPCVHGYGNATPLPSPSPTPAPRRAAATEPTDTPVAATVARGVLPRTPVEPLPATIEPPAPPGRPRSRIG